MPSTTITVNFNGRKATFDGQQPEIIGNSLMVPLRGIFNLIGYSNINWDDNTDTVSINNYTKYRLTFVIGDVNYTLYDIKNNSVITTAPLSASPYISSMGRVMIPLQAPLEAVGATINWDVDTQTIYIAMTMPEPSGTVYQGKETKDYGAGSFDVYWWRTTNTDISIVSTVIDDKGATIENWPSSCRNAVNGPLFPNNGANYMVNAFAINNGTTALTPRPPDTDANVCGAQNWEAMWPFPSQGPMDFLMDPQIKTNSGLVVVGNSGTFPVHNTINNKEYLMSDINWGLGGMDLKLTDSSFDDRVTFNKDHHSRKNS